MSKHETGTVTKQTTGAVPKHETGTVTKQTTGAVSKHETSTMTKQTTGARWGGPGGGSSPGTAAVSKHETGTVTKQTTGAVSTHETGTVTKQTTGAVSTHETGTVTTGAVSKHETVLEGGLRRYKRFKPVIPVETLKFERSKVCIRTENHTTSVNTSRFFVPWEPGGPSPNQHASATPPRIWNIAIYGANIAAGLSGQKFERSKVSIRTEIHTNNRCCVHARDRYCD